MTIKYILFDYDYDDETPEDTVRRLWLKKYPEMDTITVHVCISQHDAIWDSPGFPPRHIPGAMLRLTNEACIAQRHWICDKASEVGIDHVHKSLREMYAEAVSAQPAELSVISKYSMLLVAINVFFHEGPIPHSTVKGQPCYNLKTRSGPDSDTYEVLAKVDIE